MTLKREGQHLRLVHDTDSSAYATPWRSEQLPLPYLDPYTVVLLDVEKFDVHAFGHLLESLRPKWIVDTRTAPRLDTLAGTRSFAFQLFEHYGATYVDLFGALGLATYRHSRANPASWGKGLGELFKNSTSPSGPYVLLFDNEDLMGASAKLLGPEIKSGLNKAVSVSLMANEIG